MLPVSGSRDEVVFIELVDGREAQRVIRGTIVSEDSQFVHVSRNDGDWSIAKARIVKIRRARQ